MYALPEGTVCYPNVQMVRIECDMVGAILIETYLLQTINFHSLIATKATRIVGLNTHTPRSVMEFGTRRAQGERRRQRRRLCGGAGRLRGHRQLPGRNEVRRRGPRRWARWAHSFIEFFPTEFEAFKAFADTYPESVSLLLDTYNIMESGLPNLIKLDDYLIEKYPDDPNKRVKSARIDSGDLARGSKRLRKALDAAGKPYIKAGGLQRPGRKEDRQHGAVRARPLRLLRRGREPDHLGFRPGVRGVYKLVAVKQADGSYQAQDEDLGQRQQGHHPRQKRCPGVCTTPTARPSAT